MRMGECVVCPREKRAGKGGLGKVGVHWRAKMTTLDQLMLGWVELFTFEIVVC